MSWASKTLKKLKKHAGSLLGAMGGPLGIILGDAFDKQRETAKETQRAQEQADAEAKAIAERKGPEAIKDLTAETEDTAAENRKRRGYLSNIKTRYQNTLLAAAGTGYGKKKLGD